MLAAEGTSLALRSATQAPPSCYLTHKFRTESVIGEHVIQLHSQLIDVPLVEQAFCAESVRDELLLAMFGLLVSVFFL